MVIRWGMVESRFDAFSINSIAMNGIPKSVVIGGITFRILVKRMESWGEMHFEEREIHISEKALSSEKLLLDTLMHEMLHASLSVSGISWCDKYEEEAIVRSIENIFFPAFDSIKTKITNGI